MAIQRNEIRSGRELSTTRHQTPEIVTDPGQAWQSTAIAPRADLRAQQRILEDIFMHAAAHSRTSDSISDGVQRALRRNDLDENQLVELSETMGFLEMALRDLCAKLAPAAVERAKLLANIDPDPDQHTIFDLEGQRLDTFLRPIFTEAGIADDLMRDAELKTTHR